MLHLMQPAKAVGRLVGECGEAGFDTQQVGLNDKLEAISSARVAAKFHLDLIALTAKIAADRNYKPWSKAAMKSPGQRRGDGKGRGFHSEMAREGALAHLPSQCG